jgi:hypothetical protein
LYSSMTEPMRKENGDDEMSGLSVGSYRDRPERGPAGLLHAVRDAVDPGRSRTENGPAADRGRRAIVAFAEKPETGQECGVRRRWPAAPLTVVLRRGRPWPPGGKP